MLSKKKRQKPDKTPSPAKTRSSDASDKKRDKKVKSNSVSPKKTNRKKSDE